MDYTTKHLILDFQLDYLCIDNFKKILHSISFNYIVSTKSKASEFLA